MTLTCREPSTYSLFCFHVKARAFVLSLKMSELSIFPVFKDVTSTVGAQKVSAMYFGRHCGQNVLVLHHELTLMLVFRNSDHLSPNFIKSVSSKGVGMKRVQLSGNKDVILLLDDTGKLWRLINAFDCSQNDKGLFLLDEKCFYEWVPFRKFNFEKILAVSAWRCGFACLGIYAKSERKLLFLPTADSHSVKDYTFEEIRFSNSLDFYLNNLGKTIINSTNENDLKSTGDAILIADRFTGKTYLCAEDGRNSLINYSNNVMVSMLHFSQENCLLLAFPNGKLVFHFLKAVVDCVVFLPKKLSLMEKCSCSSSCLLWSDGLHLNHTKLIFQSHEPHVKLLYLKLHSNIEKPSHFVRLEKDVIVLTINNIYYCIRVGSEAAEISQRSSEELLSDICAGALNINEMNMKIDVISHFLHCKEILDRNDIKDRVEMTLEQNCLLMKFNLDVVLRRDFWKVRFMMCSLDKKCVKMAELETDVIEGMVMRIENPFRSKRRMNVSLIGDFDGEGLFLELGEVGESEEWGGDELSKNLQQILVKRNPFCQKEKSAFN